MVFLFFFFQAEDGIRDIGVTGVQTCALPIYVEARREREDVLVVAAHVEHETHASASRVEVALHALGENLVCKLAVGRVSVRSEERRVGKECRSRWSRDHKQKTEYNDRDDQRD